MYKNLKRLDRLLIFFIVYTLTFVIFFSTLKFTLPFILALIFATLLKKPTTKIAKKFKIKSWIAALFSTTILIILSLLILSLLTFSLTLESVDITSSLTQVISNTSPEISFSIESFNKILQTFNLDINSTMITEHLSDIFSSAFDAASIILQYFWKILSYIPFIISTSLFAILATYFFTQKFTENELNNSSSLKFNNTFSTIILELKKIFLDYFCGYFFIIFVSSFLNLFIFTIFKVKYSITLAILAGILDILPLLGISLIYIPLIIYYFLQGKTVIGLLLLLTFILLGIFREILENKIMSSSLGISPIESIICIFVGMQLAGFKGILFCLFLVVGYKIFQKLELSNLFFISE